MNVPFELHVALRYLLAKRKQAFISVISLISTLGVTVGVMALVIALALMTGLQDELRDRIVGGNPHIYVWNTKGIDDYRAEADKLRQIPARHRRGAGDSRPGADLGVARYAADDGQGHRPRARAAGDRHQGRDAQRQRRGARRRDGRMSRDGILLGKRPGQKLGVRVGDTVSVLTPQEMLTPNGLTLRPARLLRVAGTFALGLYEFDSTYGYVSIDVAQRLFGKDQVDLIQLRVDDLAARRRSPRRSSIASGSTTWRRTGRS